MKEENKKGWTKDIRHLYATLNYLYAREHSPSAASFVSDNDVYSALHWEDRWFTALSTCFQAIKTIKEINFTMQHNETCDLTNTHINTT